MVTRDIRPLVLLLLSEKSHAASLLLACKRARDAPTCYQLFSVSSGQADFFFTNRCRCRLFAVSGGQADFIFKNICRCRPFLFRAETLPLVGNAHRAFRGGKRGRMPFVRSTVKHYIIEKITQSIVSTNAMPVRRRTFRYNRVYILAVGAGAPTLRFRRTGFRL